ncbi:pteridine-dependent deoxygenase [Tahibacter amnicola]|uniref:Pteridine-dependent deoxygenase n=1 Tax=Tahibacter amnicola TaxID=2976241 RepID=A0ABY6BLM3_9GAMM|nr:pteridine-dependent deoxygenase [Tahibacter amnicola]UXI68712.1 pteridine-dependent deoxygenase [Tahibacter amnicola]
MSDLPLLHVEYARNDLADLLRQDDVLAVLGFGRDAPPTGDDPRYLRVGLEPLQDRAPLEVWRAPGPISHGVAGRVRWSSTNDYCFGAIEVAEADFPDVATATEAAYSSLSAFARGGRWPHLLRVWNYLAAINEGAGDAERYKHFCTGRSAGTRELGTYFPAASAIGRSDGVPVLQVYWLASRVPGTAVENPRQTSAWCYPRQFGPTPPTFARAMRGPTATPQLHISGTAAVVGHDSQHTGDLQAQLRETFANLGSLLKSAGNLPAFDRNSVLKAYVRHREDLTRVEAALGGYLPPEIPRLILLGDICREELLVEIDGIHSVR